MINLNTSDNGFYYSTITGLFAKLTPVTGRCSDRKETPYFEVTFLLLATVSKHQNKIIDSAINIHTIINTSITNGGSMPTKIPPQHANIPTLSNKKYWLAGALLGALLSTSANAYERIVSATGNASEIIYELGLADKIVAVDITSQTPAEVMEKKPKIGYRRILSSEGILSMTPDLLILAPDAGPQFVIKQLQAAKLKTITIKDEKTLDGVVADIEQIADTLAVKDKAQPMIATIRKDEAELNQMIAAYPRKPNIMFFMDSGLGRFMGLGAKTAGDGMIHIVGGNNVFAEEFNGVKSLSLEALATGDMDMIIIASHGGKDENDKALTPAVEKYPKLAITKAGQKQCVFTIGIIEALGFGPHITTAAKQIAEAVPTCLKGEHSDKSGGAEPTEPVEKTPQTKNLKQTEEK